MAMICIHGGECDGCMNCLREPDPIGKCTQCGTDIFPGDDYYNIEGDTLLHDDCLVDWADKYRVYS